MKWPRGRYNGKRITGFSVKIKATCFDWHWIPRKYKYACFAWLCFKVWVEAEYDWWREKE